MDEADDATGGGGGDIGRRNLGVRFRGCLAGGGLAAGGVLGGVFRGRRGRGNGLHRGRDGFDPVQFQSVVQSHQSPLESDRNSSGKLGHRGQFDQRLGFGNSVTAAVNGCRCDRAIRPWSAPRPPTGVSALSRGGGPAARLGTDTFEPRASRMTADAEHPRSSELHGRFPLS